MNNKAFCLYLLVLYILLSLAYWILFGVGGPILGGLLIAASEIIPWLVIGSLGWLLVWMVSKFVFKKKGPPNGRPAIFWGTAIIVGFIYMAHLLGWEKDPSSSRSHPTSQAQKSRKAGQFEINHWPEEGLPIIVAKGGKIPLLREPFEGAAKVAELNLPLGTSLGFSASRYRTIVPGKIQAISDAMISVRDFGRLSHLDMKTYFSLKPERELHLSKGDELLYLQYRGRTNIQNSKAYKRESPSEGSCFVSQSGIVFEVDLCPKFNDQFELIADPQMEWWIKISPTDQQEGWVLVDGQKVVEITREYYPD